jgi:D-arabinose 1-dehydrogenase-like Zn-dependent alcohol dehydrogenase
MSILAAVMPGPREAVEIREFAEPALEDGSVLLETLYSEVCGTDVHIWHGRLSGVPYPIIPGHVSVGVAAKIRGQVRGVDGRTVREGDCLRTLSRLHRDAHTDALRTAARLRHHRFRL